MRRTHLCLLPLVVLLLVSESCALDGRDENQMNLLLDQSKLNNDVAWIKDQIRSVADLVADTFPFDCSMANRRGDWKDTTKIKPPGLPLKHVRCDQYTDGGGWTVIVHRDVKYANKYSASKRTNTKHHDCKDNPLTNDDKQECVVNFNRTWNEYKEGFGRPQQEYWIGNEVVHVLTKDRPWEALMVAEDWDGKKGNATWSSFSILGEDKNYLLHIYGLRHSSLGDGFTYHNNMPFSTYDKENYTHKKHCGMIYGGGWWFNDCHVTFLTGLHMYRSSNAQNSIHTLAWKNRVEPLKVVSLMIRPRNWKPSL